MMIEGKVVYAGATGLADVGHDVTITPTTVFHGASLTKQVTALAIAELASEGKIDIEEDIRTYLPELAYRGPEITVQHLLDHMSGLREASSLSAMAGWRRGDVFSEDQRQRLLENQVSLNFAPGARVEYSNSGYALLGEIIERTTGVSYREHLQGAYFDPLGMTQTIMRTDLSEIIPHRAMSYQPTGDGFLRDDLRYELVASTGIQTTVLDLLIWARALNEQTVGSVDAWRIFEERTFALSGDAATLGRGQEKRSYRSLETWSHGGTDAGYRSFLIRVPGRNFAVAVMSNRFDVDTAKLAYGIIDDIFFGSPREPAEFQPASSADLQAYAGDYELFPGVIFSITTDGKALYFAPYGSTEGAPIPQIGPRRFLVGGTTDLSIAFDRPVGGKSPGFAWTLGLHGSIPGMRLNIEPVDPDAIDTSAYLGRYYSEELDVFFDVSTEDGALVLRHPRVGSSSLLPFTEDVFFGDGPVQEVRFVRGPASRVSGALFSNSLADDVWFQLQPSAR
ncbi:serine hydrolase [Parvularcula sp. ZS-1/3]|uniref:Serine hydrolase n=1 Tax=Parvularcula mediterranea TaxID=2732508 RepID=A0A7Y3RQI5_9PROT|nr:serine hydrolase [Parvularcula mediterranea]